MLVSDAQIHIWGAGARRLRAGAHLLGTDITRSPISYRQHIELFTKHVAGVPEEVMGAPLCKWLGWPLS